MSDNESRRKNKSKKSHKKKSKKHKRHSRSRSRSSEEGRSLSRSPSPKLNAFDVKRLQEIERIKQERRVQKEQLKAQETAEEKRARRLKKKELKDRKRHEKAGWDEEYMGYTNKDNPFGDQHLRDTFTWHAKYKNEGKDYLNPQDIEKFQQNKMQENKEELEKVKKRRQEREKEREEREKEREMLQRSAESEYYRAWEMQEDTFHLKQALLRSKIRIQDGRAKPIDLLARYVSADDGDDVDVEMHEPYTYLNGLNAKDLEDLLEDIKVYEELEAGRNADYWGDLRVICKHELQRLLKEAAGHETSTTRRDGVNESVKNDVTEIFKGKTYTQLSLLKKQIERKLNSGEGDVGYWESLSQQLDAHMSRTRLRERHQDVLRRKLFRLKQQQGIESTPLFPIIREDNEDKDAEVKPPATNPGADATFSTGQQQAEETPQEEDLDAPLVTEEDMEAQCREEYLSGRYSPVLLSQDDLTLDDVVLKPEEDRQRLTLARNQVVKSGSVKLDTETEFEKKAREGMNDDEATFGVEVSLDDQQFVWSDKYRPRKPRFFNRVHTGFEWNKYNQTHYDMDNPPPKIVQGYKFNIFYPDLIDKTQTPEYSVTPIEENTDFGILRFKAGPPYEDIAFKIVNREWECSWKHGFRCQFSNNIFQLWFHFKRYRYRR